MISAKWETPISQIPTKDTDVHTIIIDKSHPYQDDPILSEFEKLLKKLSLELETNGVKNIYSHQPQLFYDSKGPVPFPKTVDLDDKSLKVQTNEIQSLLAKYGITCPGAESVEVSADSSDPFVTVITIKKTYF